MKMYSTCSRLPCATKDHIWSPIWGQNSCCVFSWNKKNCIAYHDDVMRWKFFLHYRSFERGILRAPMDFPHKRPTIRDLVFPSLLACTHSCLWFEVNILNCIIPQGIILLYKRKRKFKAIVFHDIHCIWKKTTTQKNDQFNQNVAQY